MKGDDRTGRFVHDLLDQAERVLGALAEADKRNVRSFAGCRRATS